ncbi:Oidioi.mRNA.OKI2018_I69.chr2.g6961.t1.cds [Oikopleura dioica]|uniref:Oidioi.mRNA.OKI2018_I69.chr2.g6961.t1.cds n=1 Tax=Oikopleura dioica TaxID=34765 RepID=A0ABN7T703_OIKDI|nr:Oidioi.mRNA.OKI2018_I69.chr2.g6961.t1.cds [Oikopleura dioica]
MDTNFNSSNQFTPPQDTVKICNPPNQIADKNPSNSTGVCSSPKSDKVKPMTINEAFDRLRDVVPSFPFERKISKIETLRLALSYIELLVDTLAQPLSVRPSDYLQLCARGKITEEKKWKTTDLTTRLQWIKWD